MDDVSQTHNPHICRDGSQVGFPNQYASYEEFRKENLLNLVFERLKLMVRFHEVVTWSIQELVNKIKALHDNELFSVSIISNDEYDNLFKDFNKMSIQTQHLKQLIYFLQRSFDPSEQITTIQENLSKILELYSNKSDIDLKLLIVTTCQYTDLHMLSSDQLIAILWFFDIDAHTIFEKKTYMDAMYDCLQKFKTIIASYDIDVKNALDDL